MEGVRIDGNNILEVYDTIRGVREYCIQRQKPYLVECMTFRMRGHEEASGIKYIPKELFEQWQQKDPITNYEEYLLSRAVINVEDVEDDEDPDREPRDPVEGPRDHPLGAAVAEDHRRRQTDAAASIADGSPAGAPAIRSMIASANWLVPASPPRS